MADRGIHEGGRDERLEAYRRLVLRWNRRLALVSRRGPEKALDRLIDQALQALEALPAGVRTLIDVGSGSGLPGIPIAIARPGMTVRLVERSANKQLFLKEAVRTLGLEGIELVHESFEPKMVRGPRPLAVTAVGLGGYVELAASVRPRLKAGDGLLLFIGRDLAEGIVQDIEGLQLDWRRLRGSDRTGVAWIEAG